MASAKSVRAMLAMSDATMSEHGKRIAEEAGEQLKAVRRLSVRCLDCRHSSALRLWTFIQDRYYVRPHGCTGGDYWADTEVQCCHIVCPKCSSRNYIYIRPDKQILVEVITKVGFYGRQKLFDPKIIVESEPQNSF